MDFSSQKLYFVFAAGCFGTMYVTHPNLKDEGGSLALALKALITAMTALLFLAPFNAILSPEGDAAATGHTGGGHAHAAAAAPRPVAKH